MGSNHIIIPDAHVQVLITGDEDLSDKNQEKEIYTKKAVTKIAGSEEKESLDSQDQVLLHNTSPPRLETSCFASTLN